MKASTENINLFSITTVDFVDRGFNLTSLNQDQWIIFHCLKWSWNHICAHTHIYIITNNVYLKIGSDF